ncbi:MAG TPA: DUF5695 domain-containing protein [Steroidobacteraceae bacterium]|nr:DUF5695 domain-containing protein [Steroidobacteraceae bacterium]
MKSSKPFFAGAASLLLACVAFAQEQRTPTLVARLRADTQTLASLSPVADRDFDFLPSHLANKRRGDGFAHLGDLNIRLRTDRHEWRDFSSYRHRVVVRVLPTETANPGEFAAADISATFGEGLPLRATRRWRVDGRALVLTFSLLNTSATDVEIGGLGMPLVFDNILTDRTLDQAHTQASFSDPSIASDAGYVQVTRLNGHGPALLVLPEGRTPFETWRPLLDDATKRGHTFEGVHEWMLASRGYAEKEWVGAGEPWNPPTSFTLKPGQSREFGLRFVTAPSIRSIESVLIAERRPVVIGIPGYVLPTDLDGTLFVAAPSPIERFEVSPAGALLLEPAGAVHGWQRFAVRGRKWGRARLDIQYADGTKQSVGWFVTKPAGEAVRDLASFITRRQFFDDAGDPFGRAPGILSFDRDADRMVTQDTRVWISGMSDEAGAGSWVAAMMKQLDDPNAGEVALLERVIDETIHGKLQVADGEHAGGVSGKHAGGVKKSLFWYDPKRLPNYYDPAADWTTWTSWSKPHADSLERSFNYPHVAVAHWVFYRLARDHTGLVTRHDWRWYLDRAALTARAMTREAPYYSQFGQMEGEVFLEILRDLRREGLDVQADELEAAMKKRADHWRALAYPFGSEMPWDSTGQPEVYAWLRHFGDEDKAALTREVILGYDPAIPGWGYNGNARRYWDFLYGGKLRRVERQIHHYGSALNAVPLFDAYRANPSDFHLLRVAYGGLMGALTNIDERGFGSAAFHSWPDEMRFDALTGDYGMGFFGHAYATASYLVEHPAFGWLAFGGNLSRRGETLRIEPRDSARARLFIAPAKLWITLAAGRIDAAEYSPADGSVRLWLAPADAHTPRALLSVEAAGKPVAPADARLERGYQAITLGSNATMINLPGAH